MLTMVSHYRSVRKAVYAEGTRPPNGNQAQHKENQKRFKDRLMRVCADSNLDFYTGAGKPAAVSVWHHLWTKNRYAGIRSQIATNEIADIKDIFDDYEIFSDPSWDIEVTGQTLIKGGPRVHDFLNRTGIFAGKQTIGNCPKLKKIVSIARQLKKFVDANPNAPVLNFITNGKDVKDVWTIHSHLMDLDYKGDLTALHFMMDLGFPVIKPDIVISKLFLAWGWLHQIIPDLPRDLTVADLHGKGKYGGKYDYTKPKMYKPIIDLARRIVEDTDQGDLEKDIGWVTTNPLREFDLCVVKYGQQPEQEFGIVRTLFGGDNEVQYSRSCATK